MVEKSINFAEALLKDVPERGDYSLSHSLEDKKLSFPNLFVPLNSDFRVIADAFLGNLIKHYGEGYISVLALSSVVKPLVLPAAPPTDLHRIRLFAALYYSQVAEANYLEYMSGVLGMTMSEEESLLGLSLPEITKWMEKFVDSKPVMDLFRRLLDDLKLPNAWKTFLQGVKFVNCVDCNLWAFSANLTLYLNVNAFEKGAKKTEDNPNPVHLPTLLKLTLASIALHEGLTMALRKGYNDMNVNTSVVFQPRFNQLRQPHSGLVAQVEFFHYDAIDWYSSFSLPSTYCSNVLQALEKELAIPISYQIFSFHHKFVPGLFKVIPAGHYH